MSFVKFPSITNHYQAKWIQKVLEFFPDLPHEQFVVMEKLHGSNIQVYFEPGEGYRAASRNRFLEPSCKFYNVWGALDRMGAVLYDAKHWAHRSGQSLRLFGELHGGKIQAGINYGPQQNILFFGAMVNDQMISTHALLNLNIPNLRESFVPILHTTRYPWETFKTILDFNINRASVLTPMDHEGPNLIEGVVIQPYTKVYRMPSGSTFMLKKKNDLYLTSPKKTRTRAPVDAAIANLRAEFLLYITEARVDSIISQEGPFTNITQLGHYIVLVLNDAKVSFFLGHRDLLSKKDQKYIFNVGGLIANMLKARL